MYEIAIDNIMVEIGLILFFLYYCKYFKKKPPDWIINEILFIPKLIRYLLNRLKRVIGLCLLIKKI